MVRGNQHTARMRTISQRTRVLSLLLCAALAGEVSAQGFSLPVIPITPEPVGSGARALGQSAFIAVADDATAASWNPAGLINLEKPEASFVGAWRASAYDYSSADPRISIGDDSWSEWQVNFMSFACPLRVGNANAVLSVNYHQTYNFRTQYNYVEWRPANMVLEVTGESRGAVAAYSLAGGVSLPSLPEIAIGGSFNWYAPSFAGDYAWQVNNKGSLWLTSTDPRFEISHLESQETYDDLRAYNFTFGLLWDAYERDEKLLTLGFVCHTPYTARVDLERAIWTTAGRSTVPATSIDIDFPLSLGAGVNYRFSDTLSGAFDGQWTQWSEFKERYADGSSVSPIGSDTLAFRLGFERLWFSEAARRSVFAGRGGVFYEPRPTTNGPDPLPVYGFSLGAGWTVKERFSLDFAYQFRRGSQDLPDFDYDVQEHLLLSSLIVYF
jgi:hypothetical protein